MSKPKIRVLRHLARSGGTLISKCIGSMDDVVLLSEVHPANLAVTNPMRQAAEWFGLISASQLSAWKMRKGPSFEQFIWACHDGAAGQKKTLVIRDWTHMDYHAFPFGKPTYLAGGGNGLRDALSGMFEVVETSTVRHPLDQFLSLTSTAVGDSIPRDLYLDGCAAFAEAAVETGYIKYESFTDDPDGSLGVLCERLGLGFDAGYRERWSSYEYITGDTVKTVGRGNQRAEIRPLKRREIDEGLLEEFRGSAAYQKTCELLGYEA